MKTYLTINEETYAADNAGHLVSQMRNASLTTASSDAKFMSQVAQREAFNSGATIRTDTAAHFVADLIAAGHLKIIPNAVDGDDDVKEEK